jgi:tetratricopeptide (TPR) repeat protein
MLDLWLDFLHPSFVREILQAADPDSYRDALRDAIAARQIRNQRILGNRPEALTQRPGFAAVLGQLDSIPEERRRLILETALRRRPGDLALLTAMDFAFNHPEDSTEEEDWALLRWMQAAVAAHPRNPDMRCRLAWALYEINDYDGSIAEFREALRLDPASAKAHIGIGDVLDEKKDLDGAIKEYQGAIGLNPNDDDAHLSMGLILVQKKELDRAIEEYRKAIFLNPNNPWGHHYLGNALEKKGDTDGALPAYQQAVRLDPSEDDHWVELISLLGRRGDRAEALAAVKTAERENPMDTDVLETLSWLLATGPEVVRHGKEAVRLATSACELTEWQDFGYLDTLAAAYAEDRDFTNAVKYERMARSDKKFEIDGATRRLALYLQKKPYRDPKLIKRVIGLPPRSVKQ